MIIIKFNLSVVFFVCDGGGVRNLYIYFVDAHWSPEFKHIFYSF